MARRFPGLRRKFRRALARVGNGGRPLVGPQRLDGHGGLAAADVTSCCRRSVKRFFTCGFDGRGLINQVFARLPMRRCRAGCTSNCLLVNRGGGPRGCLANRTDVGGLSRARSFIPPSFSVVRVIAEGHAQRGNAPYNPHVGIEGEVLASTGSDCRVRKFGAWCA